VSDVRSPHTAERELIDISIPYDAAIAVWPGDVPFSCGWTARREDGSSVNLGAITTSTHAGTHADAPLHVNSEWAASESLPASVFVGECVVVSIPAHVTSAGLPSDSAVTQSLVTVEQLVAMLGDQVPSRVLLRTGSSVASGAFPAGWPVLAENATNWLVSRGVRLFGTDAPSVDARESKSLPVHRALFGAGAYVLENLDLRRVEPGRYELLAQPLAIVGADAAPVRALLRRV
jgi:arylformamidase